MLSTVKAAQLYDFYDLYIEEGMEYVGKFLKYLTPIFSESKIEPRNLANSIDI